MDGSGINKRIEAYLPDKLHVAIEPVSCAVKSVAYSSLYLVALHKYQVWSKGAYWFEGSVKILTSGSLEVVNSIKTGGMLGVASLIDSLIGILIKKAYENDWLPEKLGIQKKIHVTHWNTNQEVTCDAIPIKQKVEIQVPHWIRVAQRAAALAIACALFTAVLGPQPLLYACAIMDLTWFIFQAVRAGHNAPCEHSGPLHMCGMALMCATPEIYLACAVVLGVSYLVYLAVERQRFSSSYFSVKNGKKTGEKETLSHAFAKHYAIGLRKINPKGEMKFKGSRDYTINEPQAPSKESLKKTKREYEEQLLDIENSKLFPKSATLSQTLKQANNDILAHATTAEFYCDTRDFSIGKERMIKDLETRIEVLEKELKSTEDYALNHLQALTESAAGPLVLKEAKESYLRSKQDSVMQSVELRLSIKLKKDLEQKTLEEVKNDFDEEIEGSSNGKYAKIYLAELDWKDAKKALIENPSYDTRAKAIETYLKAQIAICNFKINQTAPTPSNKNGTVYWKALYKGQEVILPEDQIQYIPVKDRKGELKRQNDSLTASACKDFVGSSVNMFLGSLGGADLTMLLGGGDMFSQILWSVAFGAAELVQLLPEGEQYEQIKSLAGRVAQGGDEEPTGNCDGGRTPKEQALISSQAMHCAQIIDQYKPYFDMKEYAFGGGPSRSLVPVYKKDTKGNEIIGQYEQDLFPEDPQNPNKKLKESVIGIANRALIDELGIEGETDEEKHAKLEQVIAIAQGETMQARVKRLSDKAEALKKAKTESARERIEKRYQDPKAGLKAQIDNMKYKMELITPLPKGESKDVRAKRLDDKAKALNKAATDAEKPKIKKYYQEPKPGIQAKIDDSSFKGCKVGPSSENGALRDHLDDSLTSRKVGG